MWRNYLILIIRKYRSWYGLALVNLVALIIAYSLIVPLLNYVWFNFNTRSLLGLLTAIAIIAVVYVNFMTLQLKTRTREMFVRKLLGANNRQLILQLMMESLILTTFIVVTGIVAAELFYPLCSHVVNWQGPGIISTLYQQLIFTILLVLPVGVFAAIIPIRSFIASLNKNFPRLAHRQ